ncbi:basic proline-rich protein-like [Ursus arctos]|uniref:basic proline-rich protein-like n=1 Tax=Ursus arctos TaxID=9644 RepID=UPI002547BC9F|nr:basic proline-rich protein-like [Ursus arctos]
MSEFKFSRGEGHQCAVRYSLMMLSSGSKPHSQSARQLGGEEAAFFPPHNEGSGREREQERSAIGDGRSRGRGQAEEAKDGQVAPAGPRAPGGAGRGRSEGPATARTQLTSAMLAAHPGTLHNKGRHRGAGSARRLPRPGPPPGRAGVGPGGREALPRPRPTARGRPPPRACRARGAGGGGEPARRGGQGRAGEGRGGGRRSAGRPGSGRDKGARRRGLPAPPPGRRDPAPPPFPPAAITGPGCPPPGEPLAAGSSLQAGPHLPVGGERASDPGPGSNALRRRRQPPPPRAAPPPLPRTSTDGTP